MKNFKMYSLILTVCLFTLFGCDKALNLTDPNNVVESDFYTSESDAIIGLTGIYDAYQSTNLMGKRYREFDHISDNATTNNSQGWQEIETDLQTPSTNIINTIFWPGLYTVIARANSVIVNVSKMQAGSITDASKNRIIAEATFLRDYAYCDLTALWGNVPLYLKPLGPFDEPKAATAKSEIYTFMINDLISVLPNLPLTIPASEKGRIAQGAIKGLLAKYYLYQKDYPKAATILKEVIDRKVYTLYPNYTDLYTEKGEFSSESLFEINFTGASIDRGEQFSSQIDTTLAVILPTGYWLPIANLVNSYLCKDGKPIASSTTYGDKSPLYVTATPYANRDPRLRATVYTNADVTPSGKKVWKWTDVNSFAVKKYSTISSTQYTNGGPQNYYVMRYADILLMYAEAKNEAAATPDQTIYDAVNLIRRRVSMPDYPAGLTQIQMRQYIRDERRWEFALEHERYFDLQRWGITGPVTSAALAFKKYSEPRVFLWPYPQDEFDRNLALKAQGQNPGY